MNWANEIAKHCFVFLFSYSQDELVAGAISFAVYNHPSLKELTTGDECFAFRFNGAVEGMVRKAGMKKLVVKNIFPGEL